MCCGNILCFIGIHKWGKRSSVKGPYKISRHKKVYYKVKQCERCCKVITYGEPLGKDQVYQSAHIKSDIKNCKI